MTKAPVKKKPKRKVAAAEILSTLLGEIEFDVEDDTKVTLNVIKCVDGQCAAKNLASQVVLEALASTVWELNDNKYAGYEYLVTDIVLVPVKKGRFTFGVTVCNKNDPCDEKEDILLHRFFQLFSPLRPIDVREYQS